MQISSALMMNTQNDLLPSCFIASRPAMLRNDTGWPAAEGGVCGSVKLYSPSRRLVTPARYSGHAVCSAFTPCSIGVSTKLMNRPAMIQPIVPHTRMRGN